MPTSNVHTFSVSVLKAFRPVSARVYSSFVEFLSVPCLIRNYNCVHCDYACISDVSNDLLKRNLRIKCYTMDRIDNFKARIGTNFDKSYVPSHNKMLVTLVSRQNSNAFYSSVWWVVIIHSPCSAMGLVLIASLWYYIKQLNQHCM